MFSSRASSAISAARIRCCARCGAWCRTAVSCVSVTAFMAAQTSQLFGRPMLAARGAFIDAARQALDKLGVEWEPTEFQRAYNEGRSTLVPVNPAVRVKGRFARRLRYQDTELRLER
jgi:hypothetical protein